MEEKGVGETVSAGRREKNSGAPRPLLYFYNPVYVAPLCADARSIYALVLCKHTFSSLHLNNGECLVSEIFSIQQTPYFSIWTDSCSYLLIHNDSYGFILIYIESY